MPQYMIARQNKAIELAKKHKDCGDIIISAQWSNDLYQASFQNLSEIEIDLLAFKLEQNRNPNPISDSPFGVEKKLITKEMPLPATIKDNFIPKLKLEYDTTMLGEFLFALVIPLIVVILAILLRGCV